jgi:F0F1-type ATP synthase delta subunit
MKETAQYKPLLDSFFNPNSGLLDLFSRVCDNLDEASNHIVKVLLTHTKIKALETIFDLCTTEMSQADNYRNIFQQPR